MRFAVDAHAIGRHLTGNEVYIRSLLKAFGIRDSESEFVAYLSADSGRNSIPERFLTRSVSSNPFTRLGIDLPMHLRRDRPDLLHVQYTAPLACPVPVIVSVHDVSFLEHPEYFTRARAVQLRCTVRRTVRSAARVLTVSEFSRASILKVYGDLEEEKVVMVPNAAAPGFRPISRDAAKAAVSERFRIGKPYLLCVGDLQPRKNQIGLIRAFAQLLRVYPELSHDLVLAGKETWFSAKIHAAAAESGISERVRFPGFVSDSDLLQLYNACDVFVFPSFYEGFGIPVLEAMACGRAVVCSNTSALPEVVDGAAILFDPYVVDDMVKAIADVLLDPALRTRQERLGMKRAAHFNWQNTAGKTLDIYYDVAERSRPARRASSASIAP
jgi:glycosyltransferase involved in cell wall biosynthesis